MTPHPEIGRKLLWHDLKEGTVVILRRGSSAATLWVNSLSPALIGFFAGANRARPMHLYLRPQDDGTLVDDTGQEVEVYEYLGEI